jgi:hypothetical protein
MHSTLWSSHPDLSRACERTHPRMRVALTGKTQNGPRKRARTDAWKWTTQATRTGAQTHLDILLGTLVGEIRQQRAAAHPPQRRLRDRFLPVQLKTRGVQEVVVLARPDLPRPTPAPPSILLTLPAAAAG